MANKIQYGGGKVSLDFSGNVVGFDIEFSGNPNISINLPSTWVVSSNKQKNRIIGVSFSNGGFIPGNANLFDYIGDIAIQRCVVVNDDHEMYGLQIVDSADTFYPQKSKLVFSTSNDKYDKLSKPKYSGNQTKKQYIIQPNLFTKHNEYYYDNGLAVQEGTEYHIHLNTSQAMTKATHQSDSVKIYRKLNNGKLFNVSKLKKRRPGKLPKKALKLKAEKIKKSTSAGTVAPKTGADKNVSGGESPYYSGGGSD